MGAVAALVVGFFAWSFLTADEAGGQPFAACAVVLDRTASVSGEVQDLLTPAASQAFEECAEKDGIVGLFTIQSGGDGFRQYGPWELTPVASVNPSVVEDSREERLEAARPQFESAVEAAGVGPAGAGSDLLGALRDAGQFLRETDEQRDVENLHLVVLTDGLHASASVSVERLQEIAGAQLAADASDAELVPDLDGVNVVMVGVGRGETADGVPFPDGFRRELADFWSEVFELAGAMMCSDPESSATPTLIQECV